MITRSWREGMQTPATQIGLFIAVTVLGLWLWGVFGWNGLLPGNDDMMRLAQVRDLLAGQAWFDVSQTRFDTPEGGAMHWSRVPDFFIGGLIVMLTPFLGPEGAEFAALALWPRMVLAGTLAAMAAALYRLGAGRAGIVAALIALLVSHAMVQFQPGRIDHHGLELMLVLAAFAALCGQKRGWRTGVFVAACIALMLTVAMESLPYAAGLIVLGGVFWVVNGPRDAALIRGLGAGLAGFSSVAYLLDAPGMGGGRAVCDAFGNVHALALFLGGAGLVALGFADSRLTDWRRRLASGVGLGVAAGLSALAVDPSCLGSPYSAVDATVMDGWMTSVTEARSLPRLITTSPDFALAAFGFALAGLVAGLVCLNISDGQRRIAIGGLVGLTALAVLVMTWQIRAVVFGHGLAAICVGLAAHHLINRLMAETGQARVLALAGLMVLSPTTWQAAGNSLDQAPEESSKGGKSRAECRSLEAMEQLAKLPPARVFTPIDLGTAVLIHTDHTVFSAPYHRNPQAIGRAIDVFESPPEAARDFLQAAGVDYVYVCPALGEIALYARRAPEGLAAAIKAGEIPEWLEGDWDADLGPGPLFLRVRHDAVAETQAP